MPIVPENNITITLNQSINVFINTNNTYIGHLNDFHVDDECLVYILSMIIYLFLFFYI